jgi:HPt (histidine-containing phosphotransfer) domain-containing protein
MSKAWNERNFTELANLAHWLKGAGGTVGFDAFTEPALTLEQLAKAENTEKIAAAIAELRRMADRIVVSNDEDAPAQIVATSEL